MTRINPCLHDRGGGWLCIMEKGHGRIRRGHEHNERAVQWFKRLNYAHPRYGIKRPKWHRRAVRPDGTPDPIAFVAVCGYVVENRELQKKKLVLGKIPNGACINCLRKQDRLEQRALQLASEGKD